MKKHRGQKLKPLATPDTLGAKLWPHVQRIIEGQMTLADARRVTAVALLPFDSGDNMMTNLLKPYSQGTSRFDFQPVNPAEHFLYIYKKKPELCLQIMKMVTKQMGNRTMVEKLVDREAVYELEGKTPKTARELADEAVKVNPNIGVTDSAFQKQRQRLKAGSKELYAAAKKEFEGQQRKPDKIRQDWSTRKK